MHDAVDFPQCLLVVENHLGEFGERQLRAVKNDITECLAELRQHLGAGVKLLGFHIGIEYRNALTTEEVGNVTFPSSYSSCDGNGNHGCYAK